MAPFVAEYRVYYEDTDSGGVVYYANYLRFLERARTDWLRSRGVQHSRLAAEHGLVFAVRSVNVRYLAPALLDDTLAVCVEAQLNGRLRINFRQTIHSNGRLLSEATVEVVSVDATRFRPKAIPKDILRIFEHD